MTDVPWLYSGLSETESATVQKIYNFTEEFFQNPKFDASHDFNHVKRVVKITILLLDKEQEKRRSASLPLLKPVTVLLGALLHDVEDKKYASSTEATMPAIQKVLLGSQFSLEEASVIQRVVDGVSYSSEIENPRQIHELVGAIPELAVVQDADRLDAIGAIGIGRCFTFGGAKSVRCLEDSIDHFNVKLLKLEGMMKTDSGRQMAAERSRRIREFMSWWQDETL